MLRIEMEYREGVGVLRFEGRMAAGLDTAYIQQQTEVAKSGDSPGLVVDLTEVPAIGSTGIGVLVSLYTSAKNRGRRFVLAAPQKRVREVLEFTRVATIIPMAADVESAVREIKSQLAAGGSA
jgi:anti-sigma B factor antagonist